MVNNAKLILVAMMLMLCSCAGKGYIYTDVTEPECVDMRSTKIGSKVGIGRTIKVEIPTTRIDLTAEWSSRAIGDAAKANNISTIYFCDKRTLSFFGGLYLKQQIIVYGD